ncbi:MAG: class II aldolase/adducin family protein [Alphaproteobacteria bacterium]|nr:class II aldolase/adducin family protein [Alphaproteobacteria bacterium]
MDLEIRKKLAACYQILSKQKMDDLTYTHLSARSSKGNTFFIYPFGSTFEEVTKDSLLEVTLDGQVIHGSEKQYNKTGYITHSNIYKYREDINAIMHLHTTAGVAVSAMKFGLLPISQFALHLYERISYHNYNSLILENSEHGDSLVQDLAKNKVMILHNHGTLTCGSTIEEAMFYTHHLEQACKVQVQALNAGYDNLIFPSKETCNKAVKDLLSFEKNLGERDFNALLRNLDKVLENC